MKRLPPVKANKRCSRCKKQGVKFGVTHRKGVYYYRSYCMECKFELNEQWRLAHWSHVKHYHMLQQRKLRLERALRQYAITPTRQLGNYIGKHTLEPGMAWCCYQQHAVPADLNHFVRSCRNKNGFQSHCKACRHSEYRASMMRRKKLQKAA